LERPISPKADFRIIRLEAMGTGDKEKRLNK
jgi:hypothetical protein